MLVSRTRSVIVLGAVLVWFVLNLATLTRYPLPSCDEGFYGLAGQTMLRPSTIDATFASRYFDFLLPYPRFHMAGIGAVEALMGESLWSARLWGLAGWLAAIGGAYWAGRTLFDRRVGGWTAVLVSVGWLALTYGHNVRPHIWTGAAGIWLLGVLAKLLLDEDSPRWHWAGFGALSVLALDVHLNTIYFLAASTLLVAVESIRTRRYSRFMLFVGGATIGALAYITLRLAPSPAAFARLMDGDPLRVLAVYADPAASDSASVVVGIVQTLSPLDRLRDLLDWWRRMYLTQAGLFTVPQGVLFLAGIALVTVTSGKPFRILSVFYLFSSLAFGILSFHKWDNYAVVWFPILVLIMVSGVHRIGLILEHGGQTRSRLQRLGRAAPQLVLGAVVVMYAVGDVRLLSAAQGNLYDVYAAEIDSHVPAGTRTTGALVWWFALHDTRFMDEHLTLYAQGPVADFDAYAEQVLFQDRTTEYLVLDDLVGCTERPSPESRALLSTAQSHCTEVATLDIPPLDPGSFGTSTLYHCSAQ